MKTEILQISLTASIFLACALLPACNGKKKDTGKDESELTPFDRAQFSEVTPMLDGSAYATDVNSRVWYLRGNKAVRVTVLGDASQKLPKSFDLTAVLDSSAYLATTIGDGGLWYLHGEHAERVSDVGSLAESGERPKIYDKVFYALYLSEHKKRKDAEERANNPPEPPDSNDDYDPYP